MAVQKMEINVTTDYKENESRRVLATDPVHSTNVSSKTNYF